LLCCQFPEALEGCDGAFTIESSRVTFGRGCLLEAGPRLRALGCTRIALITDRFVGNLPFAERVLTSLKAAGLDVVRFDEVEVEPTDRSLELAARFAWESKVNGFLSLGGGSVIDTCKAANLLSSHPAALEFYVNAPVGHGHAVPGPLKPHIACPTTSGTGSEVTGIAVFDHTRLHAKTAVAAKELRPTEALVDPDVTASLPAAVVVASGLDVLCHAVESFTARPFSRRLRATPAFARPMSQGANPWSDIGCKEALGLCREYLVRAASDPTDAEAREAMLWAATLAGIAFGNAGVHLPHAMAYAIAGLAHETHYKPPGYPTTHAFVPHGVSVVLSAPAVVRRTASADPARHLKVAELLGADVRSAKLEDAGELLAQRLVALMRRLGTPNGTTGVGATQGHLPSLVTGTLAQSRLLANAPIGANEEELSALFKAGLSCW